MKPFILAMAAIGALSASAHAREWKVRDLGVEANSDESKLTLDVSKARIRVVRRADRTVLRSFDPKDVVSIWYDDKLVKESYGRQWWQTIDETCHAICGQGDVATPLVLLAMGGIGYMAAEPFSERRHFVNIRYREGEGIAWLILGTTWFDHFWLMTDLSGATGLKWLSMPLQRAKLFWTFGDHAYEFQTWATAANAEVPGGAYDVLLWEDGAGKGILMVFSQSNDTGRRAMAAEPVVIERPDLADEFPEYCRDEQGIRRLRRMSLKKKRLVLPTWDAACRRAQEEAAPPNE